MPTLTPDDVLDPAMGLRLLSAIVQGFDGYLTFVDRQRRILYMSRMLSRDPRETLGSLLEEYIAPQHREQSVYWVERAFETGEPQQHEFDALLADGSLRAVRTRIIPFQAPDGGHVAVLMTNDVTEQRGLQLQLEQSLEFRRRVIEHLPDLVGLLDRDGRLVWCNRPTDQTQPLSHYLPREGHERAKVAIEAAFMGQMSTQFEAEGQDAAGESLWHAVRVAPVKRQQGVEYALLVSADITERKRAELALRKAEEQLHRAQRLESLGQLSGGIAHDFNNLLQIIDGNLSFAQQRQARGESVADELEQALRATERAGELTSHLLAVGRRRPVVPKRVELGGLVSHSVRMLRRAIPENVRLQYTPPNEAFWVELDPPQFDQVLINLCVNARDAMPNGGTLEVCIEADEEGRVVVAVRDDGNGIAPANLQRVFEPFYTTKGAGSGLGLAVAAGIVAAHGGVISAESDGVRGTTIKIRLPRVAPETERTRETPAPSPSAQGQVLLVAEDEPMVRAQLARLLTAAGYSVLEAENGARAVEVFRQHHARVDAVLLDVIMPELDGWHAYLKMEQLKPGIKVLFSTGYAADVLPPGFAARGARLLPKPHKAQMLLSQLSELLRAPRTGT
ncbi:MAG TPA: ATP-binding protein [Polyangiales bacterium]